MDQPLRYRMRNPDTFPGRCPATQLVDQHKGIRRRQACKDKASLVIMGEGDDKGDDSQPKIMADDAISLAKVLRLFSKLSSFDRRVRRASWTLIRNVYGKNGRISSESGAKAASLTNRKLAYSAGTKQPHIAITVRRPICRRYVLFPIILASSGSLPLYML